MSNFQYLVQALEITSCILAIYQCSPVLGIAVAFAIIFALIDNGDDDDRE